MTNPELAALAALRDVGMARGLMSGLLGLAVPPRALRWR